MVCTTKKRPLFPSAPEMAPPVQAKRHETNPIPFGLGFGDVPAQTLAPFPFSRVSGNLVKNPVKNFVPGLENEP